MSYDKLEKIINESFEKKEKVGPKSDKKLIKSVNETINISSTTKDRTVISHHKCAGRENWGKSKKTLELIGEAKKNNFLDLDCYPYTCLLYTSPSPRDR